MHSFGRTPLAALLFCPASLAGQVQAFPFTENFDSPVGMTLPAGWRSSRNRTAGSDDMVLSATSARSAPNCVLAMNATVEQTIESPQFDFTGVTPGELLWTTRRSSSFNANVVCEASLDGGVSYPLLLGDTLKATGSVTYVSSSLDLPTALGGERRVRFRWRVIKDVVGSSGTLRFDDVSLTVRIAYDLSLRHIRTLPAAPREPDRIAVAGTVTNIGALPARGFRLSVFPDANGDRLPEEGEVLNHAVSAGTLWPNDSTVVTAGVGRLERGRKVLIGVVTDSADRYDINNHAAVDIDIGGAPGTLVLNELMYAPSGGEPEWMELFNRTSRPVNVCGWTLSDAPGSTGHLIAGSDVILGTGEFVVITRDSSTLAGLRPGIRSRVISMTGFPSLNNAGDGIWLYDASGATIDSIMYQPSWGGATGGISLERIDASGQSQDRSNWGSSMDSTHATAGRENSIGRKETDVQPVRARAERSPDGSTLVVVTLYNAGRHAVDGVLMSHFEDTNGDSCVSPAELLETLPLASPPAPGESTLVLWTWHGPAPGDHSFITVATCAGDQRPANDTIRYTVQVPADAGALVINEIMFAPFIGEAEYVEILNMGEKPVSLAGWRICERASGGESTGGTTLPRLTTRLGPHGIAVVASDSSIFRFFPDLTHLDAGSVIIPRQGMVTLNNDGDDVVLRDPLGATVDSIAYLPAWHNPSVVDRTGRSLERILARGRSTDAANWTSCVLPQGGTPGRQNSAALSPSSSGATVSCTPNPFSPDNNGFDDATVVHYALPPGVWSVYAKIFDARGRLIRRLATGVPGVGQGDLIWDGRDEDRAKARMGIYVVSIEAVEQRGGEILHAKAAVVLAGRL